MIDMKDKVEGAASTDELGATCTVIRKNWGQPGIPAGKIDYLDDVQFIGGVARNVATSKARKWQAIPQLGIHVLKADADESDFIQATGIKPMPAAELAAMLKGYDMNLIAEALGEENALKISQALRRQIGKK